LSVSLALLADLAYHFLSGSSGAGLVVVRAKKQLGKDSRYHPPYFTRTFPKLLDDFESAGYLAHGKVAVPQFANTLQHFVEVLIEKIRTSSEK
jgi:hypothetical protein